MTPSRFVIAVLCLLAFNGCTTVDSFPWSKSDSSDNSEILSKDGKKLVFNLPTESYSTDPGSIGKNGQYPFQAPSIKLPSPRLEVNHEVRRELANYLRGNANCISQNLSRQETLFPILAKIFQDEGLPEELLNLALIESGFRANASSKAGAVGLWQFMNGTARLYGLEVSRRVDERKDPILSTMAVARLLKQLYSKYNDWYLVLAAYNAGEGALDKAKSLSGRSDYWAMVRTGKIKTETARFVPKFIAASILQKLYYRYGNQVQLAQYIDRHIVAVSAVGSDMRYAFRLEGDVAFNRG